MKMRLPVTFFLLGVLAASASVAVHLFFFYPKSLVTSDKSVATTAESPTASPVPSAKAPQKHYYARSRPAPNPSEAVINTALEKLPVGQVYHNVPNEMKVGVEEMIEAGIAPQITQEIKNEIQGRGQVNIKSGVRFDPMGMNMDLIVNPQKFKVFKQEVGEQLVTSKLPGKWVWQVTPIEPGNHQMTILATLNLNLPGSKTRTIKTIVFQDQREVKVNWGYTISGFIMINWKELIPLIVGSGSLSGLIGWYLAKRQEKQKQARAKQQEQ
ncbi:MAG TPA: hypothetical protein DD001_08675 [Microcoleaceae bacterium UBA10368]|jgi:hypothetical protein|nr:hypothetical protein [Microcoleaceae cyanobacterium UBA10368]HCV31815.1 hypothetical protein [Microcoleaceae cyanobacterium UBA9251]